MLPVLENHKVIPDYQFGFRYKHGTPEQCHRIVSTITDTLENKQYCSAVFLDVQQAFDRVWHKGLLFKIKKLFPSPYYLLIKSYLNQRTFCIRVGTEKSRLCQINAGIPQGSVLGPVLYTIYTSDMPVNEDVITATYADDTAILAKHSSAIEASASVQRHLDEVEKWLTKWNIVVNSSKSAHITFTLRRDSCPKIYIYEKEITQCTSVKYLGLHLDRRLTWLTHVKALQKQLNIKTKKMNWLIGNNSELSLQNKLIIYKAILKPVWAYGIQLWGTACDSTINIIQRYQSKILRKIVKAPWYIKNSNIHKDLNIPYVHDTINQHSTRYLNRLSNHTNPLAISLLDTTNEITRLKRHHVLDLPFR